MPLPPHPYDRDPNGSGCTAEDRQAIQPTSEQSPAAKREERITDKGDAVLGVEVGDVLQGMAAGVQHRQAGIAEREDRLSTFLTTQRYPVPATHLRGEIGAPPHPFVLQSRLPGRPAMELLAGPHGRGVVARLGRLQGQLHRMSTANFPLRRFTAAWAA